MGLFSGVKNLLFGKKTQSDPEIAGLRANLRQGIGIQSQGLTKLDEFGKQDFGGVARAEVAQEGRLARGSAQDRLRQLRGTLARRGLSGTSLGLSGEKAVSTNLASTLSAQNASTSGRIRNFKLQQLRELLSQSGGVINKSPVKLRRGGGRRGGLAPLIGAGIGALAGGGSGAKVGLGVGQAANQAAAF